MNSRLSPKETLYFKVPTYLIDLAIHFGVFYVYLYCSDLVSASKASMTGLGIPSILFVSYVMAITVVGIRLNERRIPYYTVVLRAIAQTAITICLFAFLISAIYKVMPVKFYLFQGITAVASVILAHLLIRYVIVRIRKSGRNTLNVVMVGADENLVSIWQEMKAGYGIHGYSILGFFTDKYQV